MMCQFSSVSKCVLFAMMMFLTTINAQVQQNTYVENAKQPIAFNAARPQISAFKDEEKRLQAESQTFKANAKIDQQQANAALLLPAPVVTPNGIPVSETSPNNGTLQNSLSMFGTKKEFSANDMIIINNDLRLLKTDLESLNALHNTMNNFNNFSVENKIIEIQNAKKKINDMQIRLSNVQSIFYAFSNANLDLCLNENMK